MWLAVIGSGDDICVAVLCNGLEYLGGNFRQRVRIFGWQFSPAGEDLWFAVLSGG